MEHRRSARWSTCPRAMSQILDTADGRTVQVYLRARLSGPPEARLAAGFNTAVSRTRTTHKRSSSANGWASVRLPRAQVIRGGVHDGVEALARHWCKQLASGTSSGIRAMQPRRLRGHTIKRQLNRCPATGRSRSLSVDSISAQRTVRRERV